MCRILFTILIAFVLSSCAAYLYSESIVDPETLVETKRELKVLTTRKVGEIEATVGEARVRAGDVDPGINGEELVPIVDAVIEAKGGLK